jgi:hypothetical protein
MPSRPSQLSSRDAQLRVYEILHAERKRHRFWSGIFLSGFFFLLFVMPVSCFIIALVTDRSIGLLASVAFIVTPPGILVTCLVYRESSLRCENADVLCNRCITALRHLDKIYEHRIPTPENRESFYDASQRIVDECCAGVVGEWELPDILRMELTNLLNDHYKR